MIEGVPAVPIHELLTDDFAAAIRWHYAAQTEPHEAAFEIFKFFSGEDETLLDIGANIGNSVVSYRLFNKLGKIFSMEPLELLRPAMEAVKDIEGDKFDFCMAGASSVPGTLTLFVPSADKRPVFYLASLDSERFGPDPVRIDGMRQLMGRPLSEAFGVTEIPVTLVTVDSLNLSPTLVKIDAEGHEFGVLSGMVETIERSRPLFLLEGGNSSADVAQFMTERDYRFAIMADGALVLNDAPSVEGFYLPAEKLDEYRAKGALK